MDSSSSQPASRAEIIQEETANALLPVSSSLHFRPTEHSYSIFKISQSAEIQTDISTTSDSDESHVSQLDLTAIKLNTSDVTSDEVRVKVWKFLDDLSKSRFESSKTLEILGYRVNLIFWCGLSSLCPEELHLAYPASPFFNIRDQKRKIRRFYLKLEEKFDLLGMPFPPDSLEEFYLHLSNSNNKDHRAYILWDAVKLKRM